MATWSSLATPDWLGLGDCRPGYPGAERTEDLPLISLPRCPRAAPPPEPGCLHPRPLSSGAALPHLAAGQPADGMLLLKGSIVAARLGQAADVVELQAEALDVPGRRVLPPEDAIVVGGASGSVTRMGSSASAG